jgi:hypothetical protein
MYIYIYINWIILDLFLQDWDIRNFLDLQHPLPSQDVPAATVWHGGKPQRVAGGQPSPGGISECPWLVMVNI